MFKLSLFLYNTKMIMVEFWNKFTHTGIFSWVVLKSKMSVALIKICPFFFFFFLSLSLQIDKVM